METKDIKKLWTIKNGEATETWLHLNDLLNYIVEWSKGLDECANDLYENNEFDEATKMKQKSIVLDSLGIELLKELK